MEHGAFIVRQKGNDCKRLQGFSLFPFTVFYDVQVSFYFVNFNLQLLKIMRRN